MQEFTVNKFNFGGGTHFGWKMCQNDRCSNLTVVFVVLGDINAKTVQKWRIRVAGIFLDINQKFFVVSQDDKLADKR